MKYVLLLFVSGCTIYAGIRHTRTVKADPEVCEKLKEYNIDYPECENHFKEKKDAKD